MPKKKGYPDNKKLLIAIQQLCNHRVFLKGFLFKCIICSSEFWYSLEELGSNLVCKGCLANFPFPIEPRFVYKLNDLVKRNLFQSPGTVSGNLTVIRTLGYLKKAWYSPFQSLNSFVFSPQLELYLNSTDKNSCSDLDLVCITRGKLVVGEAKNCSEGFSKYDYKSIKTLFDAAIRIKPDILILSCSIDKGNQLSAAKDRLVNLLAEKEVHIHVEAILLPPDEFSEFVARRYE